MDFNRVSPQAKIAAAYRLLQQQSNTMISTLLRVGVDPSGITEEEIDAHLNANDSNELTDKVKHLRSVAQIKRASNIIKQKLETR